MLNGLIVSVALNYQTPDESMHWNKSLFEDNGRVGYVLKPSFMRDCKWGESELVIFWVKLYALNM